MSPRHRACRAFTVIELLVAVAIAVVLAGILIAVTRSALDLWQKAQDRSAANVQAKVALDLLARDLQSAIYRENEATMAVDIVTVGNLANHNWRQDYAGAAKPDEVAIFTPSTDASGRYAERSRFGRGRAWLRFLTTNLSSQGSGPAMVAYQVTRRPIAGDINEDPPRSIRYTLSRIYRDGEATFRDGYVATNHDDELDAPDLSQALCDNVVDFGVWCYRRNGDGTLTALYPENPQGRSFRGVGNLFPDVVDVMLRVMSESGAAQLEQMEAGWVQRPAIYTTDEEWWWAVVDANSRIHSTRVIIKGGGRL